MRTTVNLDPRDLAALKAMAEREKTTLGGVISRILRAFMKQGAEQAKLSGFPTMPYREGVVVTPEDVERALNESE